MGVGSGRVGSGSSLRLNIFTVGNIMMGVRERSLFMAGEGE